jgi:hypothetical protein
LGALANNNPEISVRVVDANEFMGIRGCACDMMPRCAYINSLNRRRGYDRDGQMVLATISIVAERRVLSDLVKRKRRLSRQGSA